MRNHRLKIEEYWYTRAENGDKTYEIRKHDRDYQVGDTLTFYKEKMAYGQKEKIDYKTSFLITHILAHHYFPEGIMAGYCILSLQPIIVTGKQNLKVKT